MHKPYPISSAPPDVCKVAIGQQCNILVKKKPNEMFVGPSVPKSAFSGSGKRLGS